MLGGIFNMNALLWSHVLIALTVLAGRRLRGNETATRWLDRVSGTLFVAMGVRLALAERG